MAYEQYSSPFFSNLLHFAKTFFLEFCVTHGQYFIHDEDLGFQMSCHGKGKADIHARRVALNRSVQKFFHTGEVYDLIEFAVYFCSAHTKDGAIKEDIFSPCEFGVKTRTYFQQAGHTST